MYVSILYALKKFQDGTVVKFNFVVAMVMQDMGRWGTLKTKGGVLH